MPNLNVFNTVYKLAKSTENIDDLRQKLGALHIDALNMDVPAHTAAGKLAFEGNHKAVALLEELGASPLGSVKGYAARRLQGQELKDNQKRLSVYLERFPNFSFQIMFAYAANGLHELAEEFLKQYPKTIVSLLSGYALKNNEEKIERYKKEATIEDWQNALVQGYAAGGHGYDLPLSNNRLIQSRVIGCIVHGSYHLVAALAKQHLATVHYIPTVLAILGYDEFVAENETIDKSVITDSTQSYELLCKERIEAIIEGYLYANNHAKVEEYRRRHPVSEKTMEKLYQKAYERNGNRIPIKEPVISAVGTSVSETITGPTAEAPVSEQVKAPIAAATVSNQTTEPSSDTFNFELAIKRLHNLMRQPDEKTVCYKLIQSMHRLKQGQENYWNPYWLGSEAKLNKIIDALKPINTIEDLVSKIESSESELYQALNSQRLLPITFLGQFGFNTAKTLMDVQEQEASLFVVGK